MVHISFFPSRDAAMHVTEVTGVEQLEQYLRNVCKVSVRADSSKWLNLTRTILVRGSSACSTVARSLLSLRDGTAAA